MECITVGCNTEETPGQSRQAGATAVAATAWR
jgi:hypothetical protein